MKSKKFDEILGQGEVVNELADFIDPTVAVVHGLQNSALEFQAGAMSVVDSIENGDNGFEKPVSEINPAKGSATQGVHCSAVCRQKGSRS